MPKSLTALCLPLHISSPSKLPSALVSALSILGNPLGSYILVSSWRKPNWVLRSLEKTGTLGMKPVWYRARAVEESPKQAERHGFQAASQEAQSHEKWKVGSPLPLWASVNPSLCSPPCHRSWNCQGLQTLGPLSPFSLQNPNVRHQRSTRGGEEDCE